MGKFPIVLDRFIFEVRFGSGYLYFDRCGQSLLDIMHQRHGWLPLSINPQTGTLENPAKSFIMTFNDHVFNFTADKPSKTSVEEMADEAAALWKIIQVNFNLEEFTRLAARLYYLLPCISIEEAEKILNKSEFNVSVPSDIENRFNVKNRHPVVVFERNNTEYRVALNTITRYDGIQPSDILTIDPRLLSKDQKTYRIAKQQQLVEYTANPMYAIVLDVDCVSIQPEIIKVKDYIVEQEKEIMSNFLPILERL
jgi:hypothetical protein